jgi:hypothetical protein
MDNFNYVMSDKENGLGHLAEWKNLTIILRKMRGYIKDRQRAYSRTKKFTAVIYERP